jgi:hypothetical protein
VRDAFRSGSAGLDFAKGKPAVCAPSAYHPCKVCRPAHRSFHSAIDNLVISVTCLGAIWPTAGRPPVAQEEAVKTTTAKQRTNQRAVKLADFDWRKFYDKETKEKLLAGCAIY